MVILFASTTVRAGNPDFATGYPKPGTVNGSIAVKGTITLTQGPKGMETAGGGTIVVWQTSGGVQKSFAITIAAGQSGVVDWGEAQTDGSLTSGVDYNVVVQISVKDLATGKILPMATPVGTAKPK